MKFRKYLKRQYKQLRKNKYILKFGSMVKARNLWFFNKYSVTWGITIGVMCSWIPMPFHTTIAVIIAVLIDCNIPLVVTSIWVANPATMPFMYFIAYRLGEAILRMPTSHVAFHPSIKDLMAAIHDIWQPLLLGCLILSIISGLVVNTVVRFIWTTPALKRRLVAYLRD